MIVMEPALEVMDVAMLPALNRHFSRFSLTGDPPAQLLAAA